MLLSCFITRIPFFVSINVFTSYLAQPSDRQVAYLRGFQAIFRLGAVNGDTQMTHSSSLYLRESNKKPSASLE